MIFLKRLKNLKQKGANCLINREGDRIMIYADNAATTKLDIEAFEAMKPYLLEQYSNASQPYSFARSAKRALKIARETIASCINAEPEEIYFTSGGSESDNWAIKSSMYGSVDKKELLTTQIEHHAILHTAATVKRMGYEVRLLPVTATGTITPEIMKKYITDSTKLVSVMFANNEIGSIQPIKELATIAHEYGAIFHTDAVQAVGHIPIDVKELGVDMLSASAHKFNGPKGVGFLWVKKGILLEPYMDGGKQERGMRSGTENIAGIVGMAVALKNNCNTMNSNCSYLKKLEAILLEKLQNKNIDFIRNGSEFRIPGNISLSFKGFEGEMLLHRLDFKGICVSTGSACDSQNTQISHVLKAINLQKDYALGTIRISLSKANSIEDVQQIANAIVSIING